MVRSKNVIFIAIESGLRISYSAHEAHLWCNLHNVIKADDFDAPDLCITVAVYCRKDKSIEEADTKPVPLYVALTARRFETGKCSARRSDHAVIRNFALMFKQRKAAAKQPSVATKGSLWCPILKLFEVPVLSKGILLMS